MADHGYFASISATDGTFPGYSEGYFTSINANDGSFLPKYSHGFMVSLNASDGTNLPAYSSGYTVSINGGQGTSSNEVSFVYILTSITAIIPEPAPLPGAVTIVGTMLDKVTAVWMDGKRASWRPVSNTQLYATIPVGVSSTTIEVHLDYQI